MRKALFRSWVAQRSHREVARSLGVDAGAVAFAVGVGAWLDPELAVVPTHSRVTD